MIIRNEKIKSISSIIVSLGISVLVPWMFYWLIDMGIYNYVMNTVKESDRLQVYTEWYTNYEWILFIVEFLLNISVTIILLKYVLKLSLQDLKDWFSIQDVAELVIGLLLGAITVSIVFFLLVLTGNATVVSWQPYLTISALKYLIVFIFVGISEELFYRGFIVTSLRTFNSKPFVIIISSIIFSLVHIFNNEFNLMSFLNIILIGVVFAYMFIELKSLWMPIGFHILWNYFQGNVYGFNVSGLTVPSIFTTEYKINNLFNGGDFGPEAGLFTTLITLFAMLFLKWYLTKRKYFSDI